MAREIAYCSFCGKSSEEDKNFNYKRGLCNKHLIQMKRYGKCFTEEELKEKRSKSGKVEKKNKVNGDKIYWKEKGHIWCYNLELLKEFVKIESNKYASIKDMTKGLGVYESFFSNIEKEENIKFEYNFNVELMSSNNVNYKAIYQDYDWCYQKFMVEGLNHKQMAELADCSVRVIEKWCTEIHKLTQKHRQSNKKLNEIQRDLVVGSLLGDGHIDKREGQSLFIVSHAQNQKDYLYWKYEILKDFCNIPPRKYEGKERVFGNKAYMCQDHYRIATRLIDDLDKYKIMSISEIIKELNEFSLSIFVLDDGYREKGGRWQLCVAMFSDEDKQVFINKLNNEFGIDGYICSCDNRYINFTKENSKKLDKIILANIPNELDVIKYKILKE